MFFSLIRFYTITLNTLIGFRKIANINKKAYELILFICLSFPISASLILLHKNIPELDYIFLFVCTSVITKLFYKKDFLTAFMATIFSIGLNLILFIVAIIINIPFMAISGILLNFDYPDLFELTTGIFIFIVHSLIMHSLFKIKSFKKGIPFLIVTEKNYVGFFVCLCAIIIYSLFGNDGSSYTIMSILVIALVLIGIFLYFWWKDQTKQKYVESIIKRQQIAYENQLGTLKTEVSELQVLNENLGTIIHKDNKIVVAMTSAIEQLLATYPNDSVAKESLDKLHIMAKERNGILNQHESNNLNICHTGSIRIDSIINYMHKRAKDSGISLILVETVDLSHLDKNTENDICTLIADTVENAIIATNCAGNKDILLQLTIDSPNICIVVFDSGILFTKKVIQHMGRFRCTTHKDTGGSGIGMMTTFEILKRYQASYAIDETIDKPPFTKSITITFDNKHKISYNNKIVR